MATFDLFGGFGQSNAQGRGVAAESPTVAAGDGYEYVHGGGLVNPIADPTDGAVTGSMFPAFCNEYLTQTGRRACIVVKASGGTAQADQAASGASNHWDVDGDMYTQSLTVLSDTITDLTGDGHTFELKGILWCQGERDAQRIDAAAHTKAVYKAAFEAMIARYRAIYEDLPFYVLRTGHLSTGDTTGFQQVRAAQDEVATADPLTVIAFDGAADFPENGKMVDTLHYTQPGYNEMGTEGAQGVAAFLDAPVVDLSALDVPAIPSVPSIPSVA